MKKLMMTAGVVAAAFSLQAGYLDGTPTASCYNSFEANHPGIADGFFTLPTSWSLTTEQAALPLTAYSAEDAAYNGYEGKNNRRTDIFGDNSQQNYLALDMSLTDELSYSGLTSADIYIDQLVKFTGFEDAPQIDETAKIAVWMKQTEEEGDDAEMYVTAGVQKKSWKIAGDWKIGKWYRLTVKTPGKIFADNDNHVGFIVYIDGQEAGIADWDEMADTYSMTASLPTDTGNQALLSAGKLFCAMTEGDVSTLAYRGTGAIDDLVIDNEGPQFVTVTPVDVNVTLPANTVISNILVFVNNAWVSYKETDLVELKDGPIINALPGTKVKFVLDAVRDYKYNALVTSGEYTVQEGVDITVNDVAEPLLVKLIVSNENGDFTYRAVSLEDAFTEIAAKKYTEFTLEVNYDCAAYTYASYTLALGADSWVSVNSANWTFCGGSATTATFEGDIPSDTEIIADENITLTYGGTVSGKLRVGGSIEVAPFKDIKLSGSGTIGVMTTFKEGTIGSADTGKVVAAPIQEEIEEVTYYVYKLTDEEPDTPDPVVPGYVTDADDEDDATAKATYINNNKDTAIAVPAGVTGDAKTAYLNMLAASAVQQSAGWAVIVDLTDTAKGTLKTDLDAAVAAPALTDADPESEVQIDAKPGLYYWIEGGIEVSAITMRGASVMATSSKVNLSKPELQNVTNKAFYQIKVGVKPPMLVK